MQNNSMTRFLDRMKLLFICDGNLRGVFQFIFIVVGCAVGFLDFNVWRTGWLYIVGFVIGGIGGYAARAHQLGIRPFEPPPYPRGWFKGGKSNLKAKKDDSDEDE